MPAKEKLETQMMMNLNNQMDGDDVMKIKYFCRGLGTFTKADFASLDDFPSIFFALKTKEMIDLGDYKYLIDLFEGVDMPLLKTIVIQTQNKMANSDFADGGATRTSAGPGGAMIQHGCISSGIGGISNIQTSGGSINISIGGRQ